MRTTHFTVRLYWRYLPLGAGGCLPLGAGGICLWVQEGCLPLGGGSVYHTPFHHTPPWTEWLADRCKNITLLQTSFAGGKYNHRINVFIQYSLTVKRIKWCESVWNIFVVFPSFPTPKWIKLYYRGNQWSDCGSSFYLGGLWETWKAQILLKIWSFNFSHSPTNTAPCQRWNWKDLCGLNCIFPIWMFDPHWISMPQIVFDSRQIAHFPLKFKSLPSSVMWIC